MTLADPIINVTTAAGLYSQIAGLLAGFAFTALMVYLARPAGGTEGQEQEGRQRSSGDSGVALALLATLVALVVVAVLYAVLAGGPDASGAAYMGIIIYGTAFSLAILSMFHTLGLLAGLSPGLHAVANATRLWTAVVGPTTALMLVSSASLDVFYYSCGETCSSTSQLIISKPFGLGLLLSGILFITSLAIYIMAGWRRTRISRLQAVPTYIGVGVSVIAAITAVLLLMLPRSFRPADSLIVLALVAAFLLLSAFAITAAITGRPLGPNIHEGGKADAVDQLART